jgi:hypothetical protein
MAQWIGYGSGHDHVTRIQDAEDTLRQALEALRASRPGDERQKRAEAVRRLAERVLWARLRMKVRIAAAREAQMGGATVERSQEIASLQDRAEVIREGGLSAILAEFGAQDAVGPGTNGSSFAGQSSEPAASGLGRIASGRCQTVTANTEAPNLGTMARV